VSLRGATENAFRKSNSAKQIRSDSAWKPKGTANMKRFSGWTLLLGAMSCCILGVVFGSFSFLPVLAHQPLRTLLVDVDHRQLTSLDGPWHHLVDQSGRALYTADGKVRDDGYARNAHPVLVEERRGSQEYDFATAPTLKVPGDWNTQYPTPFRFEGVVWYERDFDYTPAPDRRTFLHIGAVRNGQLSYRWRNKR
jgi:beta-glucuronidase